jgi:hypothetical protein
MTRTRKVRRGFVAEKYASLIEALYSGRTVQHVETQVKFEDGRTGDRCRRPRHRRGQDVCRERGEGSGLSAPRT